LFEIGNTLREARLRRGLDISQCEAATKIRGKYLRAMEEEQFDVLPASTYVRGFLRSYAAFLDLDSQLILDEYESRFGVPHDPVSEGEGAPGGRAGGRRPGRRPTPRRTETQLLWLAIGGVLAVALLVWLGVGDDSSRPTAIPTTPATRARAAPPSPARAVAPAPKPKPVPKRLSVVLTGQGNYGSWVEVHGGASETGPLVYSGTLAPGETFTRTVRRALWITVGNPDGLKVDINGRTAASAGVPDRFVVTKRGIKEIRGA
jgi:cytoskeleton protein RodZ